MALAEKERDFARTLPRDSVMLYLSIPFCPTRCTYCSFISSAAPSHLAMIPEYVAGVIIAAVKESFASEVAARRVAMDSAGKNATEMIEKLELDYNRARQGAITQEITEIVAGAGM